MEYTVTLSEVLESEIRMGYKNVSQFCRKKNIPYMTVQGVIKRGVENTTVSTLQKICDALDITITQLFRMRSMITIQEKLDNDPNYSNEDLLDDLIEEKVIDPKNYNHEQLLTIAQNYRYFNSDEWL